MVTLLSPVVRLDTSQWVDALGAAFDNNSEAQFEVKIEIVSQAVEQHSDLLDAVHLPSVFTAIERHLNLRDMQHLSQACRYLHRLLRMHSSPRAHSQSIDVPSIPVTITPFTNVFSLRIAHTVNRFFPSDFLAFSRLLQQMGAIMWNDSVVHALLEPQLCEAWVLTRLDLIITDTRVSQLQDFLCHRRFRSGSWHPRFADKFFTKEQVWTCSRLSVVIVIVDSERVTPAMVLAEAPTTACMTWFSGSQLTCEYPHLTFNSLLEFNYANAYASQKHFIHTYRIWVLDHGFDWSGDVPPGISQLSGDRWSASIYDSHICTL